MKYFLDTEFHEYSKKTLFGKPVDTIELISIGIVSENNREYYTICKEFDVKAAWRNKWLRENVLLNIYKEYVHGDMRNYNPFSIKTMKSILDGFGKTRKQIADAIICFCNPELYNEDKSITGRLNSNDTPEFYGYYSAYDWVVFCWLFGRMIDLPKGFPMYCIDLKQTLESRKEELKQTITDFKAYPKQINEHNALTDAKWNYELYKFLQTL